MFGSPTDQVHISVLDQSFHPDHNILSQTGQDNWFDLAQQKFFNEEVEEAIKYYNWQLIEEPNDIKSLINRAQAFNQLGYYDESLKDIEIVL